jgi:Reverse transcriptase (RNA-dependent DNA polymerase)
MSECHNANHAYTPLHTRNTCTYPTGANTKRVAAPYRRSAIFHLLPVQFFHAVSDSSRAARTMDFCTNSYGFRPRRSPHRALAEVRRSVLRRMSTVIDVDLSRYFDTIRHSVLLDKIAKRVQDTQVLHLVRQIIKAGGKIGVPQGGPFSPLAANIYLNELDWTFDAIRRKTAQGPYEAVNYHRFADDGAPRWRREETVM